MIFDGPIFEILEFSHSLDGPGFHISRLWRFEPDFSHNRYRKVLLTSRDRG
jgi:hypothetical protein